MLRILGIKPLHLILLNLHGTQIQMGMVQAQPDDPHRDPLPSLLPLTP